MLVAEALDEKDASLDLDNRACSECVRCLFAEYDQRLDDVVNMINRCYKAAGILQKRENDTEEKPEENNADDERELLRMLESAECELEALKMEEIELLALEKSLKIRVASLQESGNDFRGQRRNQNEIQFAEMAKRRNGIFRRGELSQCRVHEELWAIGRVAEFPVICGFRLGSSPRQAVEWDEINSALGECALLLYVCGQKLNYNQRRYNCIPLGDCARMMLVGDNNNNYNRTDNTNNTNNSKHFQLDTQSFIH